MFDEANRILDERSLSQKGRPKYSSRYLFSGKIKCGRCGGGYVARYKTRGDGSRYKAWRCDQVGCRGLSIRNEDAVHIMCLVVRSLEYNKEKIVGRLLSVIKPIVSMDMAGTDAGKLKAQIRDIEDKKARLIDIYMSGDIDKEEFSAARSKCDAKIAELRSAIDSIDGQQAMAGQQELMGEIGEAIEEIVGGIECEDEIYKQLLHKMVVNDRDNIDVYLNMLPFKWSYTAAKASAKR